MPTITQQEPHFELLSSMYFKEKHRRTKAQIYGRWLKKIEPDLPQLTEKQFIDWTTRNTDTDRAIEQAQKADILEIESKRTATISHIENRVRGLLDMELDEAERIMQENEEETVPLKERYYAHTILKDTVKAVQKEKEIVIKAQAEKRESVGMFAKLMSQAQAGDITLEELEARKKELKAATS